MAEGGVLFNLGDLTKPAVVLIEKVSDAIGVLFEPRQIRRIATAKADAEKIKVLAKVETSALEQRALKRFVQEEGNKQKNMEDITAQAISQLEIGARPEAIEKDWIVNFYDKCRLISDQEMQVLWAKILSNEANNPGSYSKRTVNLLTILEKTDAELFRELCRFCWGLDDGGKIPVIFDYENKIYSNKCIHFETLKHLEDIGLINFDDDPIGESSYTRNDIPKIIAMSYQGRKLKLIFSKQKDNVLPHGKVMFTNIGDELSGICDSKAIHGFFEYCAEKWSEQGLGVEKL